MHICMNLTAKRRSGDFEALYQDCSSTVTVMSTLQIVDPVHSLLHSNSRQHAYAF